MAGGLDAEEEARRNEDGFERKLHPLRRCRRLLLHEMQSKSPSTSSLVTGRAIGTAGEIGEIGAGAS